MIVNIDISLQISQLNKTGNKKRNKGCAMGMVSLNKEIKHSVFLSKKELDKIIKYYEKKIPLKTLYVKIHSIMIFYCLKPYLNEIKKINICKDFKPTILSRELYSMFPILRNYKIKWNGGKKDKSIADKYANKVRKHPEFASQLLTLELIKSMETPHKSK